MSDNDAEAIMNRTSQAGPAVNTLLLPMQVSMQLWTMGMRTYMHSLQQTAALMQAYTPR